MTLQIKAILYGILLAYICLVSWFAYHEHDALIEYKASVKALGEAQAAQTKAKDAEHDQNTYNVAVAYSSEYERLNAALDRLRHSGSGSLPKSPISPQVPDAPISQPGDVRQDYGNCEEPDTAKTSSDSCLVTKAFFGNALKDAEDVNTWYNWAIVQGVPFK